MKIMPFLFTAAIPGHLAADASSETQATTIQQQASQSETTAKKTKQLTINYITTDWKQQTNPYLLLQLPLQQ